MNIERKCRKIDSLLGDLSSTGIGPIPSIVFEMRLLLRRIEDATQVDMRHPSLIGTHGVDRCEAAASRPPVDVASLLNRRAHAQEDPRSGFMRGGAGIEGAEVGFDAPIRASEDAKAVLDSYERAAKDLAKRTNLTLPNGWRKGLKCPDSGCDGSAERPKCLWDLGGNCPRLDPDAYDPSPFVVEPDPLCAEAAALLSAAAERVTRDVVVIGTLGTWLTKLRACVEADEPLGEGHVMGLANDLESIRQRLLPGDPKAGI